MCCALALWASPTAPFGAIASLRSLIRSTPAYGWEIYQLRRVVLMKMLMLLKCGTKRQSDLTFYRWAFYCVDVFREQDLFARSLIKVALILHTDLFM